MASFWLMDRFRWSLAFEIWKERRISGIWKTTGQHLLNTEMHVEAFMAEGHPPVVEDLQGFIAEVTSQDPSTNQKLREFGVVIGFQFDKERARLTAERNQLMIDRARVRNQLELALNRETRMGCEHYTAGTYRTSFSHEAEEIYRMLGDRPGKEAP
ncbi:hypothetical protein HAX54_004362 [Datura stramonium]|uniref:Uncharacterized protein n=1 Tax=Datura stramonium TaxID=4076 RepID=A0ABS8T821_DATST|nr:hypothetical protein [Datura stramonium]